MEPVFMATGQAAGIAAALAGKGDVQELDARRIQKILAEDPYQDGSEPDILIDEDSVLISGKENWKVVNGQGAYGRTFLSYSGTDDDNKLVYSIPGKLNGDYDIYSFQQFSGSPETTFIVRTGKEEKQVGFIRKDLKVEGQTRGEWVHLGTFRLRKGQGGSISFKGDGPDLRADAILLVRH
jgi:hypothetical protein